MNRKQLETEPARSNLSTPKIIPELTLPLSNLSQKTTATAISNLIRTTYIKPKIDRKSSLRPSTVVRPISRGQRSSSFENSRDSLYTGHIDQYSLGHTLGFGAYAVVKLAAYLPTNLQYAIKTYEKSKLLDPQRKKNVISEIKILKSISHPNIIKLKEAIDAPRQIHLVMEYVGACSLWSFLKKRPNRQLPEPTARSFFTQILSGIDYCHQVSVIHRDIKLENILLDSDNKVKIIDFGFATFTTPGLKIKLFCGTPSYMSPEIVGKRENPGAPADVWALGVLLYVMLTGNFPFKASADRELYRIILKGSFEVPASVSVQAKALIRRMLQQDPRKRPTCREILNDPWVCELRPRDCNFADTVFQMKNQNSSRINTEESRRFDKENCKIGKY